MSSPRNGQRYPAEWPERIRALQAGELEPVVPRSAATVLLLRDTAHGLHVHMLRRRSSMAFAGGAYAYPGGGVDPRDEGELAWAGTDAAAWSELLDTDTATAQTLVCAAVRETFEESGVLLAGPDEHSVVADTTGPGWEADRTALAAHEISLADLLARRGLALRGDLLRPWARWVTPEFESRRYDTWFFVAALPAGQRTRNASTEADETVWTSPAEAAAGYDRGELTMLPPTISTLRALTPHPTAASALTGAADQDLTPVLAQAQLDGEEIVLVWPGHDEFTRRITGTQREGGAR